MQKRPKPRTIALALFFALGVAGCQSTRTKGSVWPPADFYLEVVAGVNSSTGIAVRQKLQVYHDGLVVYREAAPPDLSSSIKAVPALPVFDAACSYRLAPESIRMLARMLDRNNIHEIPNAVGVPGGAEGQWLRLRCTSFHREKNIHARGRVYGPLNQVLQVINSFIPEEHPFKLPEMVGEKEPRHVVDLPPVRRSIDGSLRLHKKLVRDHSEDVSLEVDLFALSCRGRDFRQAQKSLVRLRDALRVNRVSQELFPDTQDVDEVRHLEEILEVARAGGDS